jgi:hypothetical protein
VFQGDWVLCRVGTALPVLQAHWQPLAFVDLKHFDKNPIHLNQVCQTLVAEQKHPCLKLIIFSFYFAFPADEPFYL